MDKPFLVAAAYRFADLGQDPDFRTWAERIRAWGEVAGLKGTIILAPEGINGTVAGTRETVEAYLQLLRTDVRLADLDVKFSQALEQPFPRLRVREKKEIVTFRQKVDPDQAGDYVAPREWNDLISSPDVTVIDTRNTYETRIGKFKGATDPRTANFTEFASYVKENLDPEVHPKVAMYCTGGIRCEKATAFLRQEGFQSVYHLQGGILKYLEEIPPEESLWEGDCFVFDRRVAVDHELGESDWFICEQCNEPFRKSESCPACGSAEHVF